MSHNSLPNNDLGLGPVVIGDEFSVTVPLVGGDGSPLADAYAGIEDLSGVALPAPGLPSAWTIDVAWQDPFVAATPAIVLSWEDGTTEGVEEGTYYALVSVDGVENYLGTFSLVPGADADASITPTPLITIDEFRLRVGGWADSLQTSTNAAGLRKLLSLATDDLHNAIAERYSVAWMDHPATRATERTAMLAVLATHGNLAVTGPMRDYVAYRALWRLLATQPTAKDDRGRTKEIIDHARWEASRALGRVVASVEGYGYPIVFGGATRVERG